MQLIHLIAHFSSINLLLRSVAALIISEHGERFFCCWRSSTIRRWKLENEVDDLMEEMWSERVDSHFFRSQSETLQCRDVVKKMKLNSCVNEYFRNQNFHSGLVRISSSSFLPSLPSIPRPHSASFRSRLQQFKGELVSTLMLRYSSISGFRSNQVDSWRVHTPCAVDHESDTTTNLLGFNQLQDIKQAAWETVNAAVVFRLTKGTNRGTGER